MTLQSIESGARTHTPRVTEMQVIPVAGRDSMLLNLCGAHAPFVSANVEATGGLLARSWAIWGRIGGICDGRNVREM